MVKCGEVLDLNMSPSSECDTSLLDFAVSVEDYPCGENFDSGLRNKGLPLGQSIISLPDVNDRFEGGSLLSWNIAELGSKMAILDWIAFISKFDVCLFQETWLLEPQFCGGYVNFFVPAIKGRKGRPAGGLTIWVQQELGLKIKVVPSENRDIQMVRIDRGPAGVLDLYNVYIRGTRGVKSQTLQSPSKLLDEHSIGSNVVIAGYFNSPFEPLSNPEWCLTEEEDAQWGIPQLNLPPIVRWTEVALQINAICLDRGLRALNGRTSSDRMGACTFDNGHCMSRIDYILVDLKIWSTVKDMSITVQLESDHNP